MTIEFPTDAADDSRTRRGRARLRVDDRLGRIQLRRAARIRSRAT